MPDIHDRIEACVLSIIFSAGIPASLADLESINRASFMRATAKTGMPDDDELASIAWDILDSIYLDFDRERKAVRGYPPVTVETQGLRGDETLPNAGHVLRLTRDIEGFQAGHLLLLGGIRDTGTYKAIGAPFRWDADPDSGIDKKGILGMTIAEGSHVDLSRLIPIDELAVVDFLRQRPCDPYKNPVPFQRRMPVWEWDGSFLPSSLEKDS